MSEKIRSFFFLQFVLKISLRNFFPVVKLFLLVKLLSKNWWKVEKFETLNIWIFIFKNLHKPRNLSKSTINSNIKCSRRGNQSNDRKPFAQSPEEISFSRVHRVYKCVPIVDLPLKNRKELENFRELVPLVKTIEETREKFPLSIFSARPWETRWNASLVVSRGKSNRSRAACRLAQQGCRPACRAA